METLTLQAETRRLLDLVIHSLYTQREIFLRELVANASDALDRLRCESLRDPSLTVGPERLEIRIEVDPTQRTLTVRDNGIGMSRTEVVNHIGTIGRSGTHEFQELVANNDAQHAIDMIGRFGVGFYSCFMVADEVTLTTRRAGEDRGTTWQSRGGVDYTLSGADCPRGTAVMLRLKPVDPDSGLEDYTDRWVLSRIIRRYADFVTHPIVYVAPPSEPTVPSGSDTAPAEPVLLNSMKPIWLRQEADVTADEYGEFYRHISNDWAEPMLRWRFRAEGRWEYTALVFVPEHAPYDLYYHATPYGLQLFSRRMLVAERSDDLLPRYLRFVKGVVDAADLPLNVSRQGLQNVHHLHAIRRWLTKKVLDALTKLRENEPERYLTLWREFGRALKEGVSEDPENRERLTGVLLFPSSRDEGQLTSLAEYATRMKADQQEIYYVSGESRQVVERSPHLEEFRSRGYEVLYFVEPVDELVAQSLQEFQGRRLRSVAKGQVAFGDDAERERAAQRVRSNTEQLADLLTFLRKHLETFVKDVRVSSRLTTSPACLVGEELEFSPHIDRVLRGTASHQRRTLEVNPDHPLIQRLNDRHAQVGADPVTVAGAEMLWGAAVFSEGGVLPDAAAFSERLTDFTTRALVLALPGSGPANADTAEEARSPEMTH